MRRRTAAGAVPGAPRQAMFAPRRPSVDSLASFGSFSEFSPWGHQLSPDAPSPSIGAAPSAPTAPDASLDEAHFDTEIGDPHAVKPTDVSHVERLIDLLERVAHGEDLRHVALGDSSGYLQKCFDAQGQLGPAESNETTLRLHAMLDRLLRGSPAHRDVHRRSTAQMRTTGERFWDDTRRLMEAVMATCELWHRQPELTRRQVVQDVLGPADEDIKKRLRESVLKGGIFKARQHHRLGPANTLRDHVEQLAARDGRRHADVLRRWHDFERSQAPAAERAAAAKRAAPRSAPANVERLVATASRYGTALRALAADEDSISVMSGARKNMTLKALFDREGGLTERGRAFLERLRSLAPESARTLEAESARTVQAVRDRVAELLRGITVAVHEVKRGNKLSAKDAVLHLPQGEAIARRFDNTIDATGSLRLGRPDTQGLGHWILTLQASRDPAHDAAIAGFKAALMSPDADGRRPDRDVLAALLAQLAATARRPPRPTGWLVPRRLPSMQTLDLPRLDETLSNASSPFTIPRLDAYPVTPDLNFPPPLDEPDAVEPDRPASSASESYEASTGSCLPVTGSPWLPHLDVLTPALERLPADETQQFVDAITRLDARLTRRRESLVELLDDPERLRFLAGDLRAEVDVLLARLEDAARVGPRRDT